MKVDRADSIDGTTYILTETHTYADVLKRLKEIEPHAMPIKDVRLNKALATGYKVPANPEILNTVLEILKQTPV